MNNNFTQTGKKPDKNTTQKLVTSSSVSAANPLVFQVFFLSNDQSQNVEIVETDKIDFEEIIQRLNEGESVFIKPKNQETFESLSSLKEDVDPNTWYFTHC